MSLRGQVAKSARWWWLTLASFLLGLIALAPAVLIERAAARSPNAKLSFAADRGTVWSGQGRISLAASTGPIIIPVSWRFDPRSLFGLRIGFFVDADAPSINGRTHVGFRPGEFQLRDTALSMDAGMLSIAHDAAALFVSAGKLGLRQSTGERLSLLRPANDNDPWRVEGTIGASTTQLVLGGIVNAPLGSHELTVRGDGPTINFSVLRSTGPLKLEGSGKLTLNTPRRFTFSGFATAATDAPVAIKQLGPVLADGRQRIELNTRW